MAVSDYYGQKGSNVKSWQQELNKLGAGLAVDGIWGPKTESAYQQYYGNKGTSTGAGGLNEKYNVSFKEYSPISDAELYRIAELAGKRSYDLAVSQLNNQYDRTKSDIDLQKNRVMSDYDEKAKVISNAFGSKREEMSNYSLSRGLARSSYAMDIQDRAYSDEIATLQSALSEKQQRLEDLDRNISTLGALMSEGLNKLSADRLNDIESMISKLKYEQQKEAQSVLEYNNTLKMQLEQFNLTQQQATLKEQQTMAQLNKSTSGSSGSSSSKSNTAKYVDQVISAWEKLTSDQKIEYFDANSARIRVNSYPLYQDLKRQYDSLIKAKQKKTTINYLGR